MENLIGSGAQEWSRLIEEEGAHLHLYGKDVAAPGRKMGHVTRLFGRAAQDARRESRETVKDPALPPTFR